MQDKYVGDIGDFGKFILLKKLREAAGDQLWIGINWYYVTTEEKNKDGKHTSYLDGKNCDSFRQCDRDLHRKLSIIVNNEGQRNLRQVEKAGVLPINTICYREPIVIDPWQDRVKLREEWFAQSVDLLNSAEIIFVDPDNGFFEDNQIVRKKKGCKYILLGEIMEYWKKGKSLIIYQHRDRTPVQTYNGKIDRLASALNSKPLVLGFHRFSVRDYIIIMQDRHREIGQRVYDELKLSPLFKK